MFVVVRSLFWLTVAYMVIKPGVDFPDANALSQQAMAAGSRVVAEQISTIQCDSLQCIGGKAIAAQTLNSIAPPPLQTAATPVPETSPAKLAPIPRMRPDWAG
ncbi:MAG: hypothetical protein JWQ22_1734 [Devosia sp.]|nr:hypothetical protein [Devosia sp.]